MTPQIGTDNIRPRFPHLHPEYLGQLDAEDEAKERVMADYVQDWIDGDLYDDGDVYSGPVMRLVEGEPELLGDLLGAVAGGDDAEVLQAAGRIARELEKHIKAQA